jgi:hypothetical protein
MLHFRISDVIISSSGAVSVAATPVTAIGFSAAEAGLPWGNVATAKTNVVRIREHRFIEDSGRPKKGGLTAFYVSRCIPAMAAERLAAEFRIFPRISPRLDKKDRMADTQFGWTKLVPPLLHRETIK